MGIKRIKIKKWVKIVFTLIVIFTSLYLYSRYLGTKGLIINETAVVDSNLPKNFYGLKIAQISDIHYKVTTTKDDLKKIKNEINLFKPDIVVISGDLFDNNILYTEKDYDEITNFLKSIKCNLFKYAIKGENDLKNKEWENIIKNGGFIDLNNKYEFIYNEGLDPILLIGIDSNYNKNHINKTIKNIFEEINTKYKYSILLLHEPDVIDNIDYSKFNLILSGHTHGGQIKLPLIKGLIKNKYGKKYIENYYKLDKTNLYVSSGVGTHKYKFRLFNKPSINFYRLRNK